MRDTLRHRFARTLRRHLRGPVQRRTDRALTGSAWPLPTYHPRRRYGAALGGLSASPRRRLQSPIVGWRSGGGGVSVPPDRHDPPSSCPAPRRASLGQPSRQAHRFAVTYTITSCPSGRCLDPRRRVRVGPQRSGLAQEFGSVAGMPRPDPTTSRGGGVGPARKRIKDALES